MFGRKAGPELPPLAKGERGDPWDAETVDWLGKTMQLDLRISHIERRFASGPKAPRRSGEVVSPEVIVTGFLPHSSQHVHMQMQFNLQTDGFGEGFLTFYTDQDHPVTRINVPFLDIRIRDPEGEIQNGLVEALRDSIAAGQSVAEARCWIRASDEWSQQTGEHGRWFHIDGFLVWANTQSPRLSKWALPIGMASYGDYPSLWQLRRSPRPK